MNFNDTFFMEHRAIGTESGFENIEEVL